MATKWTTALLLKRLLPELVEMTDGATEEDILVNPAEALANKDGGPIEAVDVVLRLKDKIIRQRMDEAGLSHTSKKA